jgi:hypothetical protein
LHLKSRIAERENWAPSEYEAPFSKVNIEVRKENQVSADKNNGNSKTSPSHNAPQLVEPTANTVPINHCQNQQQVSNTENSHLNDGDLFFNLLNATIISKVMAMLCV